MSFLKAEEISRRLNERAEEALRHIFRDAGHKKGNIYTIGDASGAPGESLFVYLDTGRWRDAATGQHGDLLELYSLHFGSKSEGIKRACEFLGIKATIKKKDGKRRPYTVPKKDWNLLDGGVMDYLINERKLDDEELSKARVRMKDDSYVFIYFTHDEERPCGAMYVTPPKEGGKKSVKWSKNPLPVLWGHTEVKGEFRDLIITEGQIDCLSLRSQGIKNCVSIPSGVSNLDWIEHSWEFINRFPVIKFLFDNDEAGQKGMEAAARRIGMEKCKYIILPPHIKDANEAHVQGMSLKEIINQCEDFKPSNLINASDLWDIAIDGLRAGRPQDQGIPFMGWDGDESIKFRIRPKEWTIYTGKPGNGKSALLYQLAAYLILKHNQKVFIASLEEDPAQILGYIAVKAMGEMLTPDNEKYFRVLKKLIDKNLWVYNYRGRASMEDLIINAEYTVRKYGVDHVIVDSVAKTDLNIENNEEANEFVNRVSTSVTDTGAHYHLVAHPKKGCDNYPSDTDDVKGSAAFGIEAFNCISLERSKSKEGARAAAERFGVDHEGKVRNRKYTPEEIDSWGDSRLRVFKQKVGGEEGVYDLFFNPDNTRFRRIREQNDHPYVDIDLLIELANHEECPF
jgi:twinkle protein